MNRMGRLGWSASGRPTWCSPITPWSALPVRIARIELVRVSLIGILLQGRSGTHARRGRILRPGRRGAGAGNRFCAAGRAAFVLRLSCGRSPFALRPGIIVSVTTSVITHAIFSSKRSRSPCHLSLPSRKVGILRAVSEHKWSIRRGTKKKILS
jgi:hypothetical protein